MPTQHAANSKRFGKSEVVVLLKAGLPSAGTLTRLPRKAAASAQVLTSQSS